MKSLLAALRLLRLRFHWDQLARRDPLWAVLTAPDKKGGRWTPEEFFARGELEVAALAALLRSRGIELGGARALDFGCGVGRVTGPLADRFEHVVGVDVSPKMLELARGYNRRGERCSFVLNRAADLGDLAGDSFDFVYSKLVLQHMGLGEVRAYLPELLRVLRQGGVLVFQLPAPVDDGVRGGRLKRSIPLPLVRAYRRLRRLLTRGVQFPKMEVHGMTREDTLRLIDTSGGVVVDVALDQSHGDESPGFLYIVKKP